MSTVYLHHTFLHFPIGLFTLAGILALVGLWKPTPFLNKAVLFLLASGLFFGLVSLVTGLLSADHFIDENLVDPDLVSLHRNYGIISNIIALIAMVVFFISRRKKGRDRMKFQVTIKVLAVITAVLIGVAGHLGGSMVHPSLKPFQKEHVHEGAMENHDDAMENHDMQGSHHDEPGSQDHGDDHSH